MSELNMRKGSSWESDVEGTAVVEIQVSGFISLCTDPCNNVQGISVRKRRAEDDGRMPLKKIRCTNPTEHRHEPVEVSIDPSVILVENLSVAFKKRKASDDGEAPRRKTRSSDKRSSSSSKGRRESGIVVAEESPQDNAEDICHSFARAPPESYIPLPSSSECSGEDTGHNFGFASPEEEKVFEMATSANTSRVDFENKYQEFAQLGAGGFGSVFEGVRKSDNLPVAIKHISIEAVNFEKVVCNGKVYFVICEVALMLKAAGLPGSGKKSAAVSLYDWYFLDQELILVMERPAFSMDLLKYLRSQGYLDEHEAKVILRQLVDAAIEMRYKGVFHRDIKLQNILVELDHDMPKVRIIDFGCASLLEEKPYHQMSGTRHCFPPEWFTDGEYWADPTTVWQVGAVFYSLLRGHRPLNTEAFVSNGLLVNVTLSRDVKTLLYMCLNMKRMDRATLEELQLHPALRNISPPT